MRETKELIWYYDNGEIMVQSRSEYDIPDEEENCIEVEFRLVLHKEEDNYGKTYYVKDLDWDVKNHTEEENEIINKYVLGKECEEVCERLYRYILGY